MEPTARLDHTRRVLTTAEHGPGDGHGHAEPGRDHRSQNEVRAHVRRNTRRWFHRCPDGTPVVVHSQYIAWTRCTLDRWMVRGHPLHTTVRHGNALDTEPDWSLIDRAYARTA